MVLVSLCKLVPYIFFTAKDSISVNIYKCSKIAEGAGKEKMCIRDRLEEEDPMLRVVWNEEAGEIQVQLMGEVQTEILQSLVKERFDVDISFGSGNIVYKETIKNTVEGVGHFEPLRHYAEVHLILEPGEPGSRCV